MLKKIIIIDDEPINCFIVEQLCKKIFPNSDINSYSDASFALSLLEIMPPEELPELLFLDLNMPLISGWEFLNSIREKLTIKTKTVILSSSILDEDKARAEKDPLIHSFLTKPVDLDLISNLEKTLHF